MPTLGTPFARGSYAKGRRISAAADIPQGDNRVVVMISRGDGITAMPSRRVGRLAVEYLDPLGTWRELAACSVEGGAVPSGPRVSGFTAVFTHLPARSRIVRQVRAVWEAEEDQSAEVLLATDATAEKDPDGPQPPGSVAWDNGSQATGVNTASVSVSSFAVASNSNRLLLATIGANNSSGAPGTVSTMVWNTSENFTQVTSWDVTQTDTENWGYYLLAPTATTATASVTLSASVNRLMLGISSYYNVNQSTPHGTIQSAQGTTGTTAAVGCASEPDAMSVAFLFGKTEGASLTVASHAGYPYYVAVGTASQSAGATSLTPTGAPAGRLLGDVEFCSIATENNNAISCSGTGWTKIGSTVQQDSTWQQETWYRIYDGSNVDPAFSWSGSVGCSARRWLMRDLNMADFIGFEATNSGSTSTHSTTGQNTTADLSRVMYVDHAEANTAIAQPSGWTENFDAGSATGPYRLAVGGKDVATSGTGSGNISVTGAAASWVQRQIELLAATAQSHRFEAESIDSGTCCGALATEPGATYNTFRFDVNNTMSQWVVVAVSLKPATGDVQVGPLVASASGSAIPKLTLDLSVADAIAAGTALPKFSLSLGAAAAQGAAAAVLGSLDKAFTAIAQGGAAAQVGSLALDLVARAAAAASAPGNLEVSLSNALALAGASSRGSFALDLTPAQAQAVIAALVGDVDITSPGVTVGPVVASAGISAIAGQVNLTLLVPVATAAGVSIQKIALDLSPADAIAAAAALAGLALDLVPGPAQGASVALGSAVVETVVPVDGVPRAPAIPVHGAESARPGGPAGAVTAHVARAAKPGRGAAGITSSRAKGKAP